MRPPTVLTGMLVLLGLFIISTFAKQVINKVRSEQVEQSH